MKIYIFIIFVIFGLQVNIMCRTKWECMCTLHYDPLPSQIAINCTTHLSYCMECWPLNVPWPFSTLDSVLKMFLKFFRLLPSAELPAFGFRLSFVSRHMGEERVVLKVGPCLVAFIESWLRGFLQVPPTCWLCAELWVLAALKPVCRKRKRGGCQLRGETGF